jgi:hypothetical protein
MDPRVLGDGSPRDPIRDDLELVDFGLGDLIPGDVR